MVGIIHNVDKIVDNPAIVDTVPDRQAHTPMTPSDHNPPLAGIRVLELGSTVAAPFCGRLLADFGAEVIKVEAPGGDPVRTMGKRDGGKSLYAASILRGKRLMTIDLRQEAGQALVRDMVGSCDVVVENFRPGTLERWGLGYDVLSELNPGLVLARISGFGQDGPYRDRPGYGVIAEAMSGLRYLTGDADRPPSRIATSLTDYLTGLYAAFGVTLALLSRDTTGRGQVVDAALYEGAMSFVEPWIPAFDRLGHVAERSGSRLPNSTPNNLYPTSDDDFVHIAAPQDSVFVRLTAAMDRTDLDTDPRFAKAVDRSTNHEQLDAMIAEWTGSRTAAEIERTLVEHTVPVSRINNVADLFADPHIAARKSIVDVRHSEFGSVAMADVVPRLSETPGSIRFAGGESGADTRSILEGTFGMESDRVTELIESGIIQQQGEDSNG